MKFILLFIQNLFEQITRNFAYALKKLYKIFKKYFQKKLLKIYKLNKYFPQFWRHSCTSWQKPILHKNYSNKTKYFKPTYKLNFSKISVYFLHFIFQKFAQKSRFFPKLSEPSSGSKTTDKDFDDANIFVNKNVCRPMEK